MQTFAPRRAGNFRKVQLPARPPSRSIPLEGLGETLDPTLAFADEDARRRAELDEAIAAEDAEKKTRVLKQCANCGGDFMARTGVRETCSYDCQLRLQKRRARELAAAAEPTPAGEATC